MKNFNNGGNRDRGGFRPGRDGGRSGGFKKNYGNNRDGRGEAVMHSAVCADCGKVCDVPFRPTNGKPVFCKDCFTKNKGGVLSDRAPRNNFDKNERPKREESFTPRTSGNSDETSKQLVELNSKIDKLIEIVNFMNSANSTKTKAVETKTENKKEEVVKKTAPKTVKKEVVVKKSVKVTPKTKGKK
jgi:CxxC-x17-CxxC domain-containing protein